MRAPSGLKLGHTGLLIWVGASNRPPSRGGSGAPVVGSQACRPLGPRVRTLEPSGVRYAYSGVLGRADGGGEGCRRSQLPLIRHRVKVCPVNSDSRPSFRNGPGPPKPTSGMDAKSSPGSEIDDHDASCGPVQFG